MTDRPEFLRSLGANGELFTSTFSEAKVHHRFDLLSSLLGKYFPDIDSAWIEKQEKSIANSISCDFFFLVWQEQCRVKNWATVHSISEFFVCLWEISGQTDIWNFLDLMKSYPTNFNFLLPEILRPKSEDIASCFREKQIVDLYCSIMIKSKLIVPKIGYLIYHKMRSVNISLIKNIMNLKINSAKPVQVLHDQSSLNNLDDPTWLDMIAQEIQVVTRESEFEFAMTNIIRITNHQRNGLNSSKTFYTEKFAYFLRSVLNVDPFLMLSRQIENKRRSVSFTPGQIPSFQAAPQSSFKESEKSKFNDLPKIGVYGSQESVSLTRIASDFLANVVQEIKEESKLENQQVEDKNIDQEEFLLPIPTSKNQYESAEKTGKVSMRDSISFIDSPDQMTADLSVLLIIFFLQCLKFQNDIIPIPPSQIKQKPKTSRAFSLKKSNIPIPDERETFDKNISLIFEYYCKLQLQRTRIRGTFSQYEESLSLMNIADFLFFCNDFDIDFSDDKITNRAALLKIYKMTCQSGISYEKFVEMLHIISWKLKQGEQLLNDTPEIRSQVYYDFLKKHRINDHNEIIRRRKVAQGFTNISDRNNSYMLLEKNARDRELKEYNSKYLDRKRIEDMMHKKLEQINSSVAFQNFKKREIDHCYSDVTRNREHQIKQVMDEKMYQQTASIVEAERERKENIRRAKSRVRIVDKSYVGMEKVKFQREFIAQVDWNTIHQMNIEDLSALGSNFEPIDAKKGKRNSRSLAALQNIDPEVLQRIQKYGTKKQRLRFI